MIRLKQLFSTDLKPTEDTEDEVGVDVDEVGVAVAVTMLVTVDWIGVVAVAGVEEVELEGAEVDWVIDWTDSEVMLEAVDLDGATEESVRLEFCPGNVSSGSFVPLRAQSL